MSCYVLRSFMICALMTGVAGLSKLLIVSDAMRP